MPNGLSNILLLKVTKFSCLFGAFSFFGDLLGVVLQAMCAMFVGNYVFLTLKLKKIACVNGSLSKATFCSAFFSVLLFSCLSINSSTEVISANLELLEEDAMVRLLPIKAVSEKQENRYIFCDQ